MREQESLDLHAKEPFPLPESGRGRANQINILTSSCQILKLPLFASSSNCLLPQRYQKTRLDWIRIQWSILPSQTSGRWTTITPGLCLTEDKYSKPPSEERQMIINWCSSLGSVGSVGSMSSPETYGKDPLSPSTSQTRFQITILR